MRTMPGPILLALALTVLAPVRAAEPLTVVLDWTVNTNHTGLFVAEALGYYAEEGLDVAIETPPETGAAAMVLSGSAQIGVSYQEEVTMARAAGQDLVAIAAILQHNTSGFAARAETGIERPRDFAGKRYGGWGSPIEEAMVRALLAQDGGDPDAVEIVPIGSLDFFAATEAGIDFAWVFEGWDAVAAELRDVEIDYIPLATVPELDYYTPVLVARRAWLDESLEVTRAFLRATRRGYLYAIENPEAAADILLEAAPELDAELVRASQRFLASRYIADEPRWGAMEEARWRDYADWLDERGLLEGEFDPGSAFTNAYLPED